MVVVRKYFVVHVTVDLVLSARDWSRRMKEVITENCVCTKKEQMADFMLLATSSFPKQKPAQETSNLTRVKFIGNLLALDIIKFARSGASYEDCHKPRKAVARTMRRMVNKVLHRHSMMFAGMAKRLDIDEANGYESFANVVSEMFADNHFNWGRLVTLYAFGAALSAHCSDNNGNIEHSPNISDYIADYVSTHVAEWITKNGGWVSLALVSNRW